MKKQEQQTTQHNYILAILIVGVVLAGGILWRIIGLKMDMKHNTVILSEIAAGQTLSPDQVSQALADDKKLADQLKTSNPFTPPPPKPSPPTVRGILGEMAFINDQWAKAGEKIGDAEILAIEPACVKILWQGKEKKLYPIEAADISTSEKKSESKKEKKKKKDVSAPLKKSDKPQSEPEPQVQAEEDPLAWLGVQLSASVRAKMLEMWNKLTDEQKEKMKEQWNSMTQEQKEQAAKAWEQHM